MSDCKHKRAIVITRADPFPGTVAWCTKCGAIAMHHPNPDGGMGRQIRWRWRKPGRKRESDDAFELVRKRGTERTR